MSDSRDAGRGPLPPTLFLLGLLAQAGLHALIPLVQVVQGSWRLLGVVPVVAGFALAVAADGRFKAEKTAVNPFAEPSTLVTTGAFSRSRNPMYLGMLIVQVGVAVMLGSVSPLLVPPAFGWLLTARFIVMEEAKMLRIFGPAYEAYRGRVRRWI